MSFDYDRESDVICIRISNNPIVDTDEDAQGTIFDYDAEGNIVRIELLKASERLSSPDTIQVSKSIHILQTEPDARRLPVSV